MGLKGIMNGAKLPNWVGFVLWLLSIGWMAATAYYGAQATTKAVNGRVDRLEERQERRNRELNEELQAIGKKVGYIARAIE